MKKHAYLYYITLFSLLLGLHRGYLALYDTGKEEPLQVFPFSAASLPQLDQQRLEAGIPIGDMEQLQKLLRDYLS